MAKSRASSGGRGGELEGQQLEFDMNLVIKQLQRSEDKVAKEAREWEAKAKDRAEAEGKMKRRLASYPRRFLQSADEVSREVRQLEEQRDALETEAKEERAALFETIHSLRTELSVRDTELRRVEKEVVEVEGDRTFWMNRFQKEKLRTDVLERTRQSLLARVRAFHEGKGLEKVVFDRAMLAAREGGGEGGLEGFAKALSAVLAPLLEPEVTVDSVEVLEYVREAAAQEKGRDGLLSFEGLCDVVARVEGKHWETSS
jgi:small-conductance mechanosensitive channel